MAAQEQNQTIQDQLADLTETMKPEKIELSPEMKRYFDEELAKLTDKMAKNEPVYPHDLKFIKVIKKWIENEPFVLLLKTRFEENKNLHKEVEWAKVEESLKENPEAFKSITEMEKAGHEPDVYNTDKDGFDIGACSKQSPERQRSCMYDESVEMAEAMKIELMTQEKYGLLQAKGEYDNESWSWLKTPADIRKSGYALFGGRRSGDVCVFQKSTGNCGGSTGWRGSLRVLWKKA